MKIVVVMLKNSKINANFGKVYYLFIHNFFSLFCQKVIHLIAVRALPVWGISI